MYRAKRISSIEIFGLSSLTKIAITMERKTSEVKKIIPIGFLFFNPNAISPWIRFELD